jgi:L-rhamnose mutarotase
MQRMGMVIRLRAEKVAQYKALHAAPWPEMEAALWRAQIRNYSIFLQEPENLLFGYWEYIGSDYARDMADLGGLEVTKRWLALTDACQMPLTEGGAGWSFMPQVYRLEQP